MYNFALQKDMKKMLDEFEFLTEVETIRVVYVDNLKATVIEKEIKKYDCMCDLGMAIYYMDGNAVAYLDDEDNLYILKDINNSKNMNVLEEVLYKLKKKVHIAFDTNLSCFAKDINRIMYRKHDYIKEEEISIEEQEELDLKDWNRELAGQAYACNKGIL